MRRASVLDELTFIATKTARASARDEWVDWLAARAADHDGALWRLLDPGPPGRPGAGHSHVLSFGSDLAAFDRVVAARRHDDDLGHAEIRRDRWLPHGAGMTTAPDAVVGGLIVAEVLCIDPERESEWDRWYDEQHLPDMMASGAFVAGTRWTRADPRRGGTNHLTVYEIGDLDVAAAIERSAAVMPELVAAGRKHECHTGGLTWALQRV